MKKTVKLIAAIIGIASIFAMLLMSVIAPHANGCIALALFIVALISRAIVNE